MKLDSLGGNPDHQPAQSNQSISPYDRRVPFSLRIQPLRSSSLIGMDTLTKPHSLTAAKKLARLLLLPRAPLVRPATHGKRRGRRETCDGQVCVFRPAGDVEEPASPRVSCVGRVGGGKYRKAAGSREGAAANKGCHRLKLGNGAVEPVEENSPGGFGGKGGYAGACVVEWVGGATAAGADTGVGALALEERPEVNLWQRRAVKPPMRLRI